MQEILKAIKKLRVFVAYNSNIDNIISVNANLERYISDTRKPGKFIASKEGLFYMLVESMRTGKGMERPMLPNVADWLDKNIKPNRRRMGGQAGIMSNFASSLGAKVEVYTPFVSEKQKRLFRNVKVSGDSNKVKTNWIFEFQQGAELVGVKAKRSNRFIAASRPDGYEFKLKKIPDVDVVLISGFQNVKEHTDKQFKLAERVLGDINIPVHLEIVNALPEIRRRIVKLFGKVDSIGLDEVELSMLTGKELRSITGKFEAVKKLLKKVNKVYLHDKGYFMTIFRKGDAKIIKKAMNFAAVATAAEAITDIKKPSDVKKGMNVSVSEIGKREEKKLQNYLVEKGVRMRDGVAKTRNWTVVITPNRMAAHPRDIVGLGDIVSCSIVLAEIGLSKVSNT
jgi:ADP-dependent phosphofructokinase/glucokinase